MVYYVYLPCISIKFIRPANFNMRKWNFVQMNCMKFSTRCATMTSILQWQLRHCCRQGGCPVFLGGGNLCQFAAALPPSCATTNKNMSKIITLTNWCHRWWSISVLYGLRGHPWSWGRCNTHRYCRRSCPTWNRSENSYHRWYDYQHW